MSRSLPCRESSGRANKHELARPNFICFKTNRTYFE